ncbi:MAG: serine/threonine protein kinase [Fibrobacter sp.]|nr:serine/threonine protein kinase [Fibrobacter sp.]
MSQTLQLPKEGERVGSGIIQSLVSTGGSAYVYKTWNENLEIHRAVKVMSPDASPDISARFQTEGRINSKLQHQNIVQCFSSGLTSGGLPYLEMEYVSGQSLADIIHKNGHIPLPVSLAISIYLLEALHYAHTVKYTLYEKQHFGLVHRDLKPLNIIITPDGNVKLMDFGIARPVDFSIHTQANTVPGTIAYLSPEACTGCDVDFRSDIYQFGLCLYELLCGSPAFPQSDLTSLLEAKSSNKYQPVETMIKTSVDRRIITFLQRCLHLDMNLRYQSAFSCLSDLRSICDSLSISCNSSSIISSFVSGNPVNYVPRKKSKFNKSSYLVISLFLIFSITAILVFVYKSSLFHFAFFQKSDTPEIITPVVITHPESTHVSFSISSPHPVPEPGRGAERSHGAQPKKAKPKKAKPVQISTVPVVPLSRPDSIADAQIYISRGQRQYGAGHVDSAVSSFQSAIKLPSQKSRQQIVRTCVYWLAKCNTLLYKKGTVPASNYLVSWQSVQNVFPATSPEYIEASTHLQEGSN